VSQAPPAINLVHLPRVTSTMDVLDDLIAAGAPEWTVVLTDEQTDGVGRAGRAWEAEPGSALLFSVLVRPKMPTEQTGMLAIAVGVALAAFLDTLGVRVALKWPNDVLLDGRKLAGILIRTRRDALGTVANIGIGLNLISAEIGEKRRAALDMVKVDVPKAVSIVSCIVQQLAQVLSCMNISAIQESWMAKSAYLGQGVVVVDGPRLITGVLRGIDDHGALLIEDELGLLQTVVAGDVVRGPLLKAG